MGGLSDRAQHADGERPRAGGVPGVTPGPPFQSGDRYHSTAMAADPADPPRPGLAKCKARPVTRATTFWATSPRRQSAALGAAAVSPSPSRRWSVRRLFMRAWRSIHSRPEIRDEEVAGSNPATPTQVRGLLRSWLALYRRTVQQLSSYMRPSQHVGQARLSAGCNPRSTAAAAQASTSHWKRESPAATVCGPRSRGSWCMSSGGRSASLIAAEILARNPRRWRRKDAQIGAALDDGRRLSRSANPAESGRTSALCWAGQSPPVRRWRVLAGVLDPSRHVVHQIEITGGRDQAVPGCVGPAAPAKSKLDGSAGARPDSAAVGCCGRLQSWPRFGGRRAFDGADARQAVDHHRQRRSIRLGNSLIRGLTASLLFWVGSAHRFAPSSRAG